MSARCNMRVLNSIYSSLLDSNSNSNSDANFYFLIHDIHILKSILYPLQLDDDIIENVEKYMIQYGGVNVGISKDNINFLILDFISNTSIYISYIEITLNDFIKACENIAIIENIITIKEKLL